MRRRELTTQGSPAGPTAMRVAAPGAGAQPLPVQSQMPNPPSRRLVPITHADPLRPTLTSVAPPGSRANPDTVVEALARPSAVASLGLTAVLRVVATAPEASIPNIPIMAATTAMANRRIQ